MSWVSASIFATLLFSFCVLFDKYIGTSKIKSVYSFAILINVAYLPFVLITAYLLRSTFSLSISVFYSFLAGSAWFVMWIFYWNALKNGEPSRVAALFFTTPIYAAIIGIFFLHESLTVIKWVGLLIIVAGATLASLDGKSQKEERKLAYLFALLAALFSAIGNAFSKHAMVGLPPLMVNCIAYFSTIPFYLFLLKGKGVFAEVKNTLLNKKMVFQFGVRGFLGFGAIMLNMTAMGLGIVSLVTAIGGSQPILILILSLIASALFPHVIHEELGRKATLPKLAALILTVAGVVMISV